MGRKVFKRNWRLPGWLDIPLRGLKYLLLGFFVWAVSGMSAQAIAAFMKSPYGLVADVKMLNFFRFIGHTGLIVLGVLLVASVLLQNFWCRYLCPYGALLGLSSIFSPLHIRRNADRCIDCAKCAKACPAALAVDKLVKIRSAECTGCLECVAVCPAEGALWIGPKDERMPTWAFAVGIALLFFGIVGFARVSGHWKSESHKPCTSSWCRTPMKPVIRCPATRHWRSRLVTFALRPPRRKSSRLVLPDATAKVIATWIRQAVGWCREVSRQVSQVGNRSNPAARDLSTW